MKKIPKLILAAAITFTAGNALATDYIYRELMANTLPTAKCESESASIASASKNYNIKRFSKKFCQTQGYGWHVEQVKSTGSPVCSPCDIAGQSGVRCHMEDVVVECKRIKPGSVGMLPGKS